MSKTFTLAMAQLNPTVGAVDANLEKARTAIAGAGQMDAVLFPELFISGYPPEDLVLKPSFVRACRVAVEELAAELADGPAILIGTPWAEGDKLYNALAVLDGGKVQQVCFKHHLPNYGVFDEQRVFDAGPMPGPVMVRGVKLGLPICEDIWFDDVTEGLVEMGAEILAVPNGSPFDRSKIDHRFGVTVARVKETGLPLVYTNQVGGQDELVFDGASFVLNAEAQLVQQSPAWVEDVVNITFEEGADGWAPQAGAKANLPTGPAAVWQAMVLGLRDYVEKNRFPGVVLGLSGGVDSAISAAIAVDALGAERVHCVMMPYRYTSDESLKDAQDCAKALGVRYDTIAIAPAVEGFMDMLQGSFSDTAADTTEENVQSRARGVTLMALSNKFGSMVLTTGNKSEVSVGYATLYGDMAGGYNAIKDIYKMEVFELCRWRNANLPVGALGPKGEVIPVNIIDKPPTAELREDQKDEDSLPPYEALDDILTCLVDQEMAFADVVARGHDEETVQRIEHLLYIAEYKRRQAAPGVKIGHRNFGRDRRYPITNGYRDARYKDKVK